MRVLISWELPLIQVTEVGIIFYEVVMIYIYNNNNNNNFI